MKRSTPHRLPLIQIATGILGVSALVCAPAALAQHGGGGHVSAPSHAPAPQHTTSHPASAPAPQAHFAEQNPKPAPSVTGSSAAASSTHATTGFRPFGPPTGSQQGTNATAFSSSAQPPHVTIGFPPVNNSGASSSVAPVHPGPLSFSGQGHEIWQNSTSSTTQRAPAASPFATSANRVRPRPPHIIHPPFGAGPGYFYPGFGFYPFFGFGLGFGPCDPFDPFDFGCGYGYGYGYSPGYGYGFSGGYYPPSDYGNVEGAPQDDAPYGPYAPQNMTGPDSSDVNSSNDSNESASGSIGASNVTMIYLKDGTTFSVTDYWLAGNKLHYVTENGVEQTIDADQIDLQLTTDQNASRGVSVTLKPAPANAAPPSAAPASPAPANAPPQPASPTPPAAPQQ